MEGLEGLNREDCLIMEEEQKRGHNLKIHNKGAHLDCRRYSFSQRVVNNWTTCHSKKWHH